MGKKGGIKSGEVRRQKSAARDVAKMILSGEIPADGAKSLVTKIGLPETELNVQSAILAGTAIEAIKGNVRATEYLMELAGETGQTEGKDDAPYELPARVMGKEWVDINRDINSRNHYLYDFKGGRGSLKSTYCALKLIELIKANSNFCALAVRQVKDTLKDSVFAQITWAIDELGLSEEFHCTKSPMEIKLKSTGQIIFFRGADDPMKIKSIKPPRGMHIGVVWIEEADQLHGEEAYRNILQSAMRGGDDCLVFRSYNTPRSREHYINKAELKENERRMIHHSHFKNAPPEWLGKQFYEIAEHLKETNPTAYAHEYDGEAVGNGANVFENVKIETITDEEIAIFDRCYYGIDWGWYPDPFHFCECYYHSASRKLWIYGEIRHNKRNNELLASDLNDWRMCRITADNAGEGPKSIADFRSRGFDMRPAIKGPGSVEYSMKWLASLTEIIIDNKRCPHTAEEFLSYEYERDKDDKVISGWAHLQNITINNMEQPLFVHVRNKSKFRLESPQLQGLPIYAKAVESGTLRKIDEQEARTDWEFVGGELAVHASVDMFRPSGTKKGEEMPELELPKGKERLYRVMDIDNQSFTTETFSPPLRIAEHGARLNQLRRDVELQTGMSYGIISDNNQLDRTAEEFRSSKKRLINTVMQTQKITGTAIDALVYAWDKLIDIHGAISVPMGEYEVVKQWNESLALDRPQEFEERKQAQNMGWIKQEDNYAWYNDVDMETAEAEVAALKEKMMMNEFGM